MWKTGVGGVRGEARHSEARQGDAHRAVLLPLQCVLVPKVSHATVKRGILSGCPKTFSLTGGGRTSDDTCTPICVCVLLGNKPTSRKRFLTSDRAYRIPLTITHPEINFRPDFLQTLAWRDIRTHSENRGFGQTPSRSVDRRIARRFSFFFLWALPFRRENQLLILTLIGNSVRGGVSGVLSQVLYGIVVLEIVPWEGCSIDLMIASKEKLRTTFNVA